tara:strand:+ start:1636 stop:1791 length:156 start_codon:yes stop_codon:yes gene_type:complete
MINMNNDGLIEGHNYDKLMAGIDMQDIKVTRTKLPSMWRRIMSIITFGVIK